MGLEIWATSALAGSCEQKATFDLTLKQRNLGQIFMEHLEQTAASCREMPCVMVISFARLHGFYSCQNKALQNDKDLY